MCKTRTGHAEEELALQAQADQLNPRSPWKFSRYRHMGFAALMLGRDQDAIAFLQRSLAINPEAAGYRWTYRMLAAAYARTGQIDEAKRWLSAVGSALALCHGSRCLSGRALQPGLRAADQKLSGRSASCRRARPRR